PAVLALAPAPSDQLWRTVTFSLFQRAPRDGDIAFSLSPERKVRPGRAISGVSAFEEAIELIPIEWEETSFALFARDAQLPAGVPEATRELLSNGDARVGITTAVLTSALDALVVYGLVATYTDPALGRARLFLPLSGYSSAISEQLIPELLPVDDLQASKSAFLRPTDI